MKQEGGVGAVEIAPVCGAIPKARWTVVCPSTAPAASTPPGGYAAAVVKASSLCQIAQTRRPSLFATAIVALLWPRRACTVIAHR